MEQVQVLVSCKKYEMKKSEKTCERKGDLIFLFRHYIVARLSPLS